MKIENFKLLARYNGLSLLLFDSDNYASENTQLAYDFYSNGYKAALEDLEEELTHNEDKILKVLEYISKFEDVHELEYVKEILIGKSV